MQTEVNEPKEGDNFCIKQDGEDWAVVICDEEIIQTSLNGHSLRASALVSAAGQSRELGNREN